MRNEKEMFDLILNVANRDERVRAVYMNGSRANSNVKRDIFQDYDIVYVVTETASFLSDEGWIGVFGEPLISQEPDKLDKMQGRDVDFKNSYTYLMQFTDGNRIDLHIQTMEKLIKEYGTDKLTIPLLDKDNCLPQIPESSDEDYWVKKPTYGQYFSRCNNFWWVAPYCAKGLWRQEILFAIEVMNSYVRQELLTMLYWYVGTQTDFNVSIGKANKYLKAYLDSELWSRLMKTFNMGDYESSWDALITTCELFEEVAPEVGKIFNYEYNYDEAKRSFAFIKHIKELPKNATEIYSMSYLSRITITKGDITKENLDGIVNAANCSLLGGGGVDGAIHRAGGSQILEECRKIVSKIGKLDTDEAVITSGGKLSAKYVIHTVGPIWHGGDRNEEALLSNAYRNSLKLASEKGLRTIAFPNISTGVYGFPKELAAKIAFDTVKDCLMKYENIEEVKFVCFDDYTYKLYLDILNMIKSHSCFNK